MNSRSHESRAHEFEGRLLAQSRWVLALARRLASDGEAAEDLAQETWLAAFERAPDADGLRAWLARVLRNLARKARRGARHRVEREHAAARAEAQPSSAEVVTLAALQRDLVAAVLALEEPYRTTVLQRYLEDFTPRAIARRQGVPVRTVHTRLVRGLALLRARLDAEHGGAEEWLGALLAFRPRVPVLELLPALVMKNKALLVVVLALLLVLGGRAWWPRGSAAVSVGESAPALAGALQDEPASQTLATPVPEPRSALASAPAPVDPERDLRGIVVTPSGEPIAGAGLTVLWSLTRQAPGGSELKIEDRTVAEARSAADGSFSFRLEPARIYDLRAEAPGRATVHEPNLYAGEELRIVLPRAAAIVGRVVEKGSGAPLADVEVSAHLGILTAEGVLAPRTRTAADGIFRIEGLPAGLCDVWTEGAEIVSASLAKLELEEGAEVRADFELERGATLHGRVTDGATHAPVVGARLAANGWSCLREARTDADGRYELRGLKSYENLVLRAAGYGRFDWELRELPSDEVEQDFFLLPGRRASGRVVDRAGAPIAGAAVTAKASLYRDGIHQGDSGSVWTDADGRFALTDLRADLRHSLFVRAEGHASAAFDFPASEWDTNALELGDLVLERRGTIAGRMLGPKNEPLAELWVMTTIEPARRDSLGPSLVGDEGYAEGDGYGFGTVEARTDARGRYAFTDLPAGRYFLSGGAKGFARRADLELELEEGEQLTDVDLLFDPGLTIEGLVVDPEGRPLPGAAVNVYLEGDSPSRMTYNLAREGGRFRIVGLDAGSFRITADPGFSRAEKDAPPGFDVDLGIVAAGTTDLRIVLPYAASIAGAVLDADGQPVAGAHVGRPRWGELIAFDAETDAAGRFRLWAPAGTRTTLTVIRAEDWEGQTNVSTKIEDVLAGREDVLVRLPSR